MQQYFSDSAFQCRLRTYLNDFKFNNRNSINPHRSLFKIDHPWNTNQIEMSLEHSFSEKFSVRLWDVNSFTFSKDNNQLLEGYCSIKSDKFTFSMGKTRLNWGSGFGRDPFDIFRRHACVSFDPENAPELQEGVKMTLFQYAFGNSSYTIVFAKPSSLMPRKYGSQIAIKATFTVKKSEISFVTLRRHQLDTGIGFGTNTLITDDLILRTEMLETNKRDRLIPRIVSPAVYTNSQLTLPAIYQYQLPKPGKFIRFLVGVDYTFRDSQLLQMAYYWNMHGYSKNEYITIRNGIQSAHQLNAWKQNSPLFTSLFAENPYKGFLLNTASILKELPFRKNYLSFRYSSNRKWEKWQLENYYERCLDDKSQVFYFGLGYFITDSFTIKPSLSLFESRGISQYGLSPFKSIVNILFRWDF